MKSAVVWLLILIVLGGVMWTGYSHAQTVKYGQLSTDFTWPTRPASLNANLSESILPNGSAEEMNNDQPTHWNFTNWGDNQAEFRSDQPGHSGVHSLAVTISRFQSGDAKWYADPQPVSPNATYMYIDWFKATTPTTVVAQFGLANGQTAYRTLGYASPADTWQQLALPFATPVNAKSVTIFHLLNQNGSLTIDDVGIYAYQPTPLPEGIVSFTFDDGPKSFITNALPVLKRAGILTTQYVTTGKVDDANVEDPGKTFSQQDIQTLFKRGDEIAAHTVTHPRLPQLGIDQITQELVSSRQQLQLQLHTPVVDFASPYGEYDDQVLQVARQYYQSHRSVDVGYNDLSTFDPYNIRVQNVNRDTDPQTVAAWMEFAKTHKVWLVLVFHQIMDNSGAYSYGPDNFNQVVTSTNKLGIKTVTVNQGLSIMRQAIVGYGK